MKLNDNTTIPITEPVGLAGALRAIYEKPTASDNAYWDGFSSGLKKITDAYAKRRSEMMLTEKTPQE